MSQSPSPPRRGRFRFLYQFSLRTLLLVTAAVALFCNWYFQPKYHEEDLAGKELRLRRQVKTAQPGEAVSLGGLSLTGPNLPPLVIDPTIVNHGNWSLLDDGDLTLARGRFIENQEAGLWTAWYPTGGKAAEGKMQQGVKVGVWKSWYENGTLASEVTYSAKPVTHLDYDPNRPPSGGFGGYRDYSLAPRRPVASSREGPAKAWHENGKLKYEGTFAHDQQDGPWKFYDVHGRVTESGPFRAGKRHGQWTLTRSVSDGRSAEQRTIRYIDGRTEAELNDILARLKPLLVSDSRRERYAALIDLAEIGEGAAPLLIDRLMSGDFHEQAVILGAVPRMPTGVDLLLPNARELVAGTDEHVAHQARLTLFQLDPEARGRLFEPLLADAIAAPTLGLCLEELTVLYRTDDQRRAVVFAQLMGLSLQRDDVDRSKISVAAADLGGNVTPYLIAACEHSDALVRLQGITTIYQFERYGLQGRTYFLLDEGAKVALFTRLSKDPSAEVRQVAEDITAFPASGMGIISVRNSTGIPP